MQQGTTAAVSTKKAAADGDQGLPARCLQLQKVNVDNKRNLKSDNGANDAGKGSEDADDEA